MNSIPPSKDFFCVGTGPEDRALHPDRAPHTDLAMQDGVILFSGAAPQQGLNFTLRAGALVYRNQMSTLGSSEPSPQVGTAGTLMQKSSDFFLPWTEARWHPGEDITWQGHRMTANWIDGLPYWGFAGGSGPQAGTPLTSDDICSACQPSETVHAPTIATGIDGEKFGLKASINLQLSRGIWQASHVKAGWAGDELGVCPCEFREPWFQARGENPTFNLTLTANIGTVTRDIRLAEKYYPNFLNIYAYETLELDGSRLMIDFERSATWPRRPTDVGVLHRVDGEISGTEVAKTVRDRYGNQVDFDRVPKYGWETDFKIPHRSRWHSVTGPVFDDVFINVPEQYRPEPNAWRLPHKRVRTVRLFDREHAPPDANSEGIPDWVIAFVFEHPESDRIHPDDAGPDAEPGTERSIYSYLPQASWEFGRLPELNDETTLLTVQAYKANVLGALSINGAPFADDRSVWDNEGNRPNRLRDDSFGPPSSDGPGRRFPDGCPGECYDDDDQDLKFDEDTNGYQPWLEIESQETCLACQQAIFRGEGRLAGESTNAPYICWAGVDNNGVMTPRQTHLLEYQHCPNPLYWEGTVAGQNWTCDTWTSIPRDPFASWDDDEDGLIDEDGPEDPLLVHLRALANDPDDECANGKHPFVPAATDNASDPSRAVMPGGDWTTHCRPVVEASLAGSERLDPWTHQVQYVYARNNPYWLLNARESEYGAVSQLDSPRYYYFTPFRYSDSNGNGLLDAGEFPPTGDNEVARQIGAPNNPNVHPDCVPDPDFRGPQGSTKNSLGDLEPVNPVAPSGINLIKKIVRTRPDLGRPQEYIEQTWLYRYNDFGFLKAVFDPAAVQAVIDAQAGDPIKEPDDILRLADSAPIGVGDDRKPLIMYASQWYTYYNPYVYPEIGIVQCYDDPPFIGTCTVGDTYGLGLDPRGYLPMNGCDGQALWNDDPYSAETHTDPDCSGLVQQDCGQCYARYACADPINGNLPCMESVCTCADSLARDEAVLTKLGIPNAQPRFRKYMIKTARVRGGDGETHLYRFDYLGAANSAYTNPNEIRSYADAHNIAIVDELVGQTETEFANTNPDDRNEFYIYEDRFRLDLDPAERATGTSYYTGLVADARATSHYLHLPVKVKTRRVVVMNFYGIAISDRLILTPGFDGDTTSLVDNQQYELTNIRGQVKQLYDQSWVAKWRDAVGTGGVGAGLSAVKTAGRVLVELFGGHEGWHSVLRGVAWGSDGGNLYDQQCKTPEVVGDVPVQRVTAAKLNVVSATKHYGRNHDGDNAGGGLVFDLPGTEASYYRPQAYGGFLVGDPIVDPAHTIGPSAAAADGCSGDELADTYLDLKNQEPVTIGALPGGDGGEGDGASIVKYHYEFHGTSAQNAVKWKWRWQEAVSAAYGGSGNVAMEVWYFDTNGRIRFYGRGGGTPELTNNHPSPAPPFVGTYFGYDDFGRLFIQIDDADPDALVTPDSPDVATDISELVRPHPYEENSGLPRNPANLITLNQFDDAGSLKARSVGFSTALLANPTAGNPAWQQVVRTEYKTLSNRKIVYKDTGDDWQSAWTDPHTYQIEYQYVTGSDTDAQVNGVTAVRVFDKGGRFLEERIIAWHPDHSTPNQMITGDDFGWATSLVDYTSDDAPDHWGEAEIDRRFGIDSPIFAHGCPWGDPGGESCSPDGALQFDPDAQVSPAYTGSWPPLTADRIITLARSFQRYTQASTLKPTEEVVYNDFGSSSADRREVVTQYKYDLEERIARQQEPNGTITRVLFDPKRRLTKTFRGSDDGCEDWFPASEPGPDDMALIEQRLYNDGDKDCEHSPVPGPNPCTTVADNTNFPQNAGKMVRVRRFSDEAESCTSSFNPATASRDTQFVYDWRGRPVIAIEVAVGHEGGTVDDPRFVLATATVYDNLDRPLLVGTWDEVKWFGEVWTGQDASGALARIQAWSETMTAAGAVSDILAKHPLTLTQTLYDERGRPFEHRTYDVGDTNANTYSFTRTYRDDLDRAVGELSQNGFVVNRYDSLGRVIQTEHWSKAGTWAEGDPVQGGGVELTCTQTEYDAFGNVLKQVHYDRKNTTDTGAIQPKAPFNGDGTLSLTGYTAPGNVVATYSCNWYDAAKRLSATANFGTNSATPTNPAGDGFTNGAAPTCDPTKPPTWTTTGYAIDGVATNAIVNRYAYDAAGRRILSQDPRGIVTRTWYDLLGHTLLVAENYAIPEGEWPGDADGTLDYSGPTRFTAYHWTRGGLQDMIVALVPVGVPAALEPRLLQWMEGNPQQAEEADYAATALTPPAGYAVQATRFVHGADVIEETDHATGSFSKAPSLVAEVQYPGESGVPSETDRVRLSYTLDGQLAQRIDQRGVDLDYFYDRWAKLRTIEGSVPPGSDVIATGNRKMFVRDTQGRVYWAIAFDGVNMAGETAFDYDTFGNLALEAQFPHSENLAFSRVVYHHWEWLNPSGTDSMTHNRLAGMSVDGYNSAPPAAAELQLRYGLSEGSAEDAINRATAVTDAAGNRFVGYDMTGAARVKWKIWGPGTGTIRLDLQSPAAGPIPARTDRFGRTTYLSFHHPQNVGTSIENMPVYRYDYDPAGNRLFDMIVQAGHSNDRSYGYTYDQLNRLQFAERGLLNTSTRGVTGAAPGAAGRLWTLDVLGNWSGGDTDYGSVVDYTPTGTPGFFASGTRREHHTVRPDNSIAARYVDSVSPNDGNLGPPTSFDYDAAGNLTNDGRFRYVYDTFGRLARVTCAADDAFVAEYEYDAFDRRIRKKVGSGGACVSPAEAVTVGSGDYFFYDGNRVIEYYRSVAVGDPTRGAYTLDTCTAGGGGGGGGQTEKQIAEANAETPKSSSDEGDGDRGGSRNGDGATKGRGDAGALSEPGAPATGPTATGQVVAKSSTVQLVRDVVESSGERDPIFARIEALHQLRDSGALADQGIPPSPSRGEGTTSGADLSPSPFVKGGGEGGTPLTPDLLQSQPYNPGSSATEARLVRRFVYGLHYIDEQVAQITPPNTPTGTQPNSVRYVLQDVNHNVVGIVRACDGRLIRQFRHSPYGELEAEGVSYSGVGGNIANYVTLTATELIDAWHLFQGLWYDAELGEARNLDPNVQRWGGAWHARNRELLPHLGRYGSRDPNEGGLRAATLGWHGTAPEVEAGFGAEAQYADGVNPFELVGSNPVDRTDPLGLMLAHGNNSSDLIVTRDWDDIYDSIVDDGHAYLGVQGAATWGAFWGGNVTALPKFAHGMRGVSQGVSDFADYYADQVIYLPIQGAFALGSVLKAGQFMAAGTAITGGRLAKVTKDAYEMHHLLPQAPKLAKFFAKAGLNIENFVIKIPVWKHRLKPFGIHTGKGTNWNAVWKKFFVDNPNADKKAILIKLRDMVRDFELSEYVSIIVSP